MKLTITFDRDICEQMLADIRQGGALAGPPGGWTPEAQLTLAACLINEASIGACFGKNAIAAKKAISARVGTAMKALLKLTLDVGQGVYKHGRTLKITFEENRLSINP